MEFSMTTSFSDLQTAWTSLAAGTAGRYARDLAADHGVSEGQLIAAGCGAGVIRLDANWDEFLQDLPSLGTVKIITRNESIVHEKVGTFGNISVTGTMGLVLNGGVDLRLFLGNWHYAFAVTTETAHGTRRSLQVFGLDGDAVHKIFLTKDSDQTAYDAMVEKYRAADQNAALTITPMARISDRPDDAIDVEGLRTHWAALKDVHHFHSMLQQFGTGRMQALRLVGDNFAQEVQGDALRLALSDAQNRQAPIMVFVGNAGCIQIHTGPVNKVMEKNGWINIMDPEFNLHVQSHRVARCWVVRKPTRDGMITTLELYDPEGQNIAILCGQRLGHDPERQDWRDIAAALPAINNREAAE
jgi:putative hemin transport protein